MKPLWMILIGMVLFNGFLFSFNVFFPQSPTSSGLYDVNDIAHDDTFDTYKQPGGGFQFNVMAIGFVGVGGLLLTLTATFLTRDLKYVAAGALGTFVSTMWTASASVFSDMMNNFSGNPVLPSIFTAVSIAIGLCVALLILGIFTSQEQLT